jgi:amino acid adenylation domain-containing protein
MWMRRQYTESIVNNGKDVRDAPASAERSQAREQLLELTLALERRRRQATRTITPRPARASPVPLSFAHERLWFLEQLGIVGAAYNIPSAFRVQGPIDVQALERSLQEIVRRHESLRTRFEVIGTEPMQVVDAPGPVRITVVDLAGMSSADQKTEIHRRMSLEAERRFDLSRGPLFSVTLLSTDKDNHVLLITMHHIVSDGWSIGIFANELDTLYGAFTRGLQSSLPELPIQYPDYAIWQRQWMQGDVLERQLRYWREQLAGAPPSLELPTDRQRPAVASFRGGLVPVRIAPETVRKMMQLAREESATLFMVLMSTYQLLLSRWSGQNDVVVGTPIDGRRQREVEGLIGFFVNTLAFRTDVSGAPTFRQLLRRVRETALGAFAHQDLPFERLVADLQPVRDLSRQPIFQAWLVLEQASGPQVSRATNLQLKPIAAAHTVAKFDLSLGLLETELGLVGSFEFATDLFERSTIERLARTFDILLSGALADVDRPVSYLPMLSDTDAKEVLVEWNSTSVERSRQVLVHELIAQQSARTPNGTAVLSERGQLTYQELDRRSNQLANHLISLGVGPDSLVGICLERSPELIISILGILKAGGAFLPLDASYPTERLGYMLDDANLSVLVVQQSVEDILPAQHWARVVSVDEDWTAIAEQSEAQPPCRITAENLAYCIYTSGSTGRPKGVLISHGALANHMLWMSAAFPLGSDDVLLQKTPVSFDASIWEILAPLMSGARLAMARTGGHMEPAYLCQACIEFRVTVLQVVPSMLKLLLNEPRITECASLRRLFSGGEVLTGALCEQARARLKVGIHNLYGPTETCIQVVTHSHTAHDRLHSRVPIGRPIENTQVYVLDENLIPVPPGVAGHLYIAGSCLARGYLNSPALTAERFVPNPFGPPGSRMYLSGDLARYRSDGVLEFLGRVDEQLKFRGFRIERAEIESELLRHPAVRQAVVIVRTEDSEDVRLIAYVAVAEPNIDAKCLRNHLKQRLPEYMLPSFFVVMDEVPLTPSGKVDLARLPAPNVVRDTNTYVAPRTPTEVVLASVWAEVLGLPRVGIHDNFFELGGDSIRAVKVVGAANLNHLTLNVAQVFKYPTIAGLSQEMDGKEIAVASFNPPPLHLLALPDEVAELLPRDWVDAYPLSSMQQLMIDEYRGATAHHQGSGAYHIQQSFRFHDEEPSASAMRGALQIMIDSHPVLRTTFLRLPNTDAVVQGVRAFVDATITEHDLLTLSGEAQDRYIQRAMDEDRLHPFALDGLAPPHRFHWFRRSAVEFEFFMSIHHAVSDGWGNQYFLSELMDLYVRIKAGKSPAAKLMPNVLKEFVAIEYETRASRETAMFWANQVINTTAVPTTGATYGNDDDVREVSVTVDWHVLDQLRSLSKRLKTSLKATLLSAYLEMVKSVSRVDNPTVGVIANGRNSRLSDPLHALGLFWNMVPVCLSARITDHRGRIQSLQQLLSDIEPNAIYSLRAIEQSRGTDDLFFATFNFTDFHNAVDWNRSGHPRVLSASAIDRFHWPLNLHASIASSSVGKQVLTLHFDYHPRYFTRQRVEELANELVHTLASYGA